MDYKVAQDSNYANFVKEVKEALADGWTCQGGVCVRTQSSGDWTYYQALVKEEA